MSWTGGVTRTTGDIVTASQWNAHLGAGGDLDIVDQTAAFKDRVNTFTEQQIFDGVALFRRAAPDVIQLERELGNEVCVTWRRPGAGGLRWRWGMTAGVEPGGNAGSDIYLRAFSDAGSFIGTPIFVRRASLNVRIGGVENPNFPLHVTGRLGYTVPNSAPSDGSLANSDVSAWLNEAADRLTWRARKAGGVLETYELPTASELVRRDKSQTWTSTQTFAANIVPDGNPARNIGSSSNNFSEVHTRTLRSNDNGGDALRVMADSTIECAAFGFVGTDAGIWLGRTSSRRGALRVARKSTSPTWPGVVVLERTGGSDAYVWVQDNLTVRVHTSSPSTDDTIGTVVGSQSSRLYDPETGRLMKNILHHEPIPEPHEALELIRGMKLHPFRYVDRDPGDETIYYGPIAEETPEVMMDRCRAFNPINAFTWGVLAQRELIRRLEELERRVA